jgi:isoleucyl-tRNA synthetase
VIGAPLEAKVSLQAGPDLLPLLEAYAAQLPALFIVSEVDLAPGDALRASVTRASGVKCERCWKYTHDTGADTDLPTVCAPCAAAVKEILAG